MIVGRVIEKEKLVFNSINSNGSDSIKLPRQIVKRSVGGYDLFTGNIFCS